MIEEHISAIFAGQDVDGDVDVDGVLESFEELNSIVTEKNLPRLIEAIQSPENNFWTRELLSEPIANLGGVSSLEVLFQAAQLGSEEGHDNDSLNFFLIEMAESEPDKCRAELGRMLSVKGFKFRDHAEWLMEFCE